MQNFQKYYHPLPSLTKTITASTGNDTIRLRDLPLAVNNRLAHLNAFIFCIDLDPTYTAVPTVVGHNSIVNRLEFYDGKQVRFSGSFNDLRFFERLEYGGYPYAEAILGNASTNNRYWTRTLSMGPRRMAGSPTDFVLPCAALETGELRIKWGNLTDISSDTTAATVQISVIAELILLDKCRLPPFVERSVMNLNGKDNPITGKSLIAYASLANSTSFDAFAAGDIGNVNFDSGLGQIIPGVNAADLVRCYNQDFALGEFSGLAGDTRSATLDVNTRQLNLTTPTAAEAAALVQQPLVWCAPETRLTKIHAYVESSARLRWDGANGAGTILHLTRFLPQDETILGDLVARISNRLGKSGSVQPDLELGGSAGVWTPFMPFKLKFK